MTNEQDNKTAPDGAQTDAEVSGQEALEELDQNQMSEEEAWKAFPKRVQAAVTYAQNNKYDYGPKLRNVDLDHTVLSARQMNDEIVRVVLSYRPKNKFKGESGNEYLDVDLDGTVQARRQIRRLKESMPWLLISIATLSVIAALVLVPVITLVDEKADPTFVAGRTLFIDSEQPKVGAYVTYEAADINGIDRTWIIIPDGEGTSIAYVELTIFNETSGRVSLAIDTDAAELTTEDGVTVRPVDIDTRTRWPAEGAEIDPRLEVFALPLWGDKVLQSGQQLRGFMAFEVPQGSKIRSLRWSATDVANIRYN